MPKYRLTMKDFEQRANIEKFERDGFKREEIMKSMYKLTDGIKNDVQARREIVTNVFNRSKD